MRSALRQAALLGHAPTDDRGLDAARVDLNRILHLYELIKRYELLVQHLLDRMVQVDMPLDMAEAVADYRVQLVRVALETTGGNRSRAAKLLNIAPKTLYNWMDVLGRDKFPAPRQSYATQAHNRTSPPPHQSTPGPNDVLPGVQKEGASSTVEGEGAERPRMEVEIG